VILITGARNSQHRNQPQSKKGDLMKELNREELLKIKGGVAGDDQQPIVIGSMRNPWGSEDPPPNNS